MRPIRLGNFIWPNNPATYSLRLVNNLVEHRYPDTGYVSIERTHKDARELSFEGEFVGPNAYQLARDLMDQCSLYDTAEFEHPLYPTITVAVATLELKGEPAANYVKYTLSIKRHYPIGSQPKAYTPDPTRTPSKPSPGQNQQTFTVSQGDSLYSMAQKIGGGMTVASLAAALRGAIPSLTRLSPGQVLRVPMP